MESMESVEPVEPVEPTESIEPSETMPTSDAMPMPPVAEEPPVRVNVINKEDDSAPEMKQPKLQPTVPLIKKLNRNAVSLSTF